MAGLVPATHAHGITVIMGRRDKPWKSEAHLRSFADPPAFAAAIPSDGAAVARGEHIARTRGCMSCHGKMLQGELFREGPFGYRSVAANIARLSKHESAAMLERAIRHGIGHDGRALYDMPSYNFIRMRADVADLIAYLRSVPASEHDLPSASLGWKIRWDLAGGNDAKGPPDLVIAGSYEKADFIKLMRTGKAAGNRELRMMSGVARARFAHWTDGEMDDLYAFLRAMSAKAMRGGSKK